MAEQAVLAARRRAADDRTSAGAQRIGALALDALRREVLLSPKPGLVTPDDAGSHADMDVQTFLRSLRALHDYFPAIAQLGVEHADFAALQSAGVAAEHAMLAATGGVNTHRGAIFNLGLLCAAAGSVTAAMQVGARPHRDRQAVGPAVEAPLDAADAACDWVARRWGTAIHAAGARAAADSHGRRMLHLHGCGGARAEAAAGFPAARTVGLPAHRAVRAQGGSEAEAAIQALFALIAEVDDSNLLWRGGPAGLRYAKVAARGFLAAGGVAAPDWQAHARRIGDDFVARRLSPGGSADLLGVTLFLAAL